MLLRVSRENLNLPFSFFYIPYARVNCLKTISFTAAHTYIVSIYGSTPLPPPGLGVRTCELFLCFVAIVRIRVYYVDFFVFFVLRQLICFVCFTFHSFLHQGRARNQDSERYPVTSFHDHSVPNHFVPSFGHFVPPNSHFVPKNSHFVPSVN